MTILLALLVGLAVGGLAVWLVMRERLAAGLRGREELANQFESVSSEVLRRSRNDFLDLARTQLEGLHSQASADLALRQQAVEQLVKPIRESLEKVDVQVRSLEESRQHAYGGLKAEVEALRHGQEQLRGETTNLVRALRSPGARGQWGEMQLRRALEMAGMLEHCDFDQQPTSTGDDGLLRPDVVVRLAGGKNVIVDAKVPLEALLDAVDHPDEAYREARLDDFVRNVRDHMAKLSAKAYWRQFAPSPEFVIMFLASESFYRYAVERDGTLLQVGPTQRVILASPTTLIALLLSAASGWREETLAESARQISEQGRELYERLATMGGHVSRLGSSLGRAVDAYNEAVGSLESRVLVTARRFPELGVPVKSEIPEVPPVEKAARSLGSPELTGSAGDPSELRRKLDAA